MNIAMIGAGYVGLTTGACLAELGHHVTCVDVDDARIQQLRGGAVPIHEPGLQTLIAQNLQTGRLAFTSDLHAIADAAAVFLAVGTPSRPDGSIDLTQIEGAGRTIAPLLRRGAIVVVKSTVVPGSARRLREIIAETRGDLDISVASNPEFLREGSAVQDFMTPDRIVIGTEDARSERLLERIYHRFIADGVAWLVTSTTNAETIKYAANALLALKIGFINEIADLCEAVGGDVRAVAKGVGLDRRIGSSFLAPGPGFGGSCFPKDTRALVSLGRQRGAPLHIVETLIARNTARRERIASGILQHVGNARGRIAVLGVAFKADTDDVRESAALSIVPILQQAGCEVALHDPKAARAGVLPGAAWFDDPYSAARDADVVVILTEWPEYRDLDARRLREVMAGNVLFDCRNVVEAEMASRCGLHYVAIGRSGPARNAHEQNAAAAPTRAARVAASPS